MKSIAGTLAAPFPYFGGKSNAAESVWAAFGDVANYVEAFAGSAAMLLSAPEGKRVSGLSFCAKFAHVFTVCGPFLFRVSSFFGRKRVTDFALSFNSIASPSVTVKIGDWLDGKASPAFLFRNYIAGANLVFDIFVMSIPAKIRQVIVGFCGVGVVTAFHAVRADASECQKHQAVNFLRYDSAVDVKADFWITPFVQALSQLSKTSSLATNTGIAAFSFDREYFPALRCKVAREAWDWFHGLSSHLCILPKPTYKSKDETLWCSPHCVPPLGALNFDLFEAAA